METQEIFKRLFPDNEIILEKVNYGGIVSVFIVSVPNVEKLEKVWREISSTIASYYQAHLKSDFEKWNIYIIYKCYEKVTISLMYKIENDKFSSRKIVHVVQKEEKNELLNNILIANYITNKDLELSIIKNNKTFKDYQSNSEIWEYVSKGRIKLSRNSTKEVEAVLEEIETKLKYED
ncbi:ABC-three component system middle component 1 [Spirosoma gilvum]